MLDGRVKTLHPKVHGGLLYIRGNTAHEAAVHAHGISPIDLVVVNLYPFEATVAKRTGKMAHTLGYNSFGAALAAALVGFWPPLFWVMWVRSRRIRAMETLLPGALEQLADCLHGGQTLEQAAELMTVQTASPLKEEFGYCVQLLKMGQSPVGVMERLSRRIPLPEFRLFATAVLVHRQTGGNLAQLTARLAVSARDRQEWRRHLGAQTVTGRYSALGLIACGVVGITVLSLLRPEYTRVFFTHPRGPGFLLTAVVLMIIGTIWVSRVIRVHY